MQNVTMVLTDKIVGGLKTASAGQYHVRDEALKGFFVTVGKRRKTYMVNGDLRRDGKRIAQVKLSVGDASQVNARQARKLAKTYLGQIAAGIHPLPEKQAALEENQPVDDAVSLKSAWLRYLKVHLIRKGRSEKTIAGYRDHCERLLKEWMELPLAELASDPVRVARMHDRITNLHGPYLANGCMRTFRAIYNHARKTNKSLPADNPADAVDWNPEYRRNTGMGLDDLPDWFDQLSSLDNPIRREYHWFTLLSGCRPTALKMARIDQWDVRKRLLHIAKPKGGAVKAFDIPLSREMMRCLIRAKRMGSMMYPDNEIWLFPADSKQGHLVEQKEDRYTLSKWGNDLRQSFRTIAAIAGVSDIDAKLLMNHALPGVNSGYITRHKLVEDHLRKQQQRITDTMMASIAKASKCGNTQFS